MLAQVMQDRASPPILNQVPVGLPVLSTADLLSRYYKYRTF